jgi:ABC-type glycerol-3-phosphate transport system substrate-binding protein
MKLYSRIVAILLIVTCIGFETITSAEGLPKSESVSKTSDINNSMDTFLTTIKYANYYAANHDAAVPQSQIVIPAVNYINKSGVKIEINFEKDIGESLYCSDISYVEWSVDIVQDGLYNINVKYYPVKGNDSSIVRSVKIDGKQPFTEADSIVFDRTWKDSDKITDALGNEMVSQQIESPSWTNEDCKDISGLYNDPFKFYLTKGRHTIRFDSVQEPIVIKELKIYNKQIAPSYEEIKNSYEKAGYKSANDTEKIQAENMLLKSDPSIYAECDRTSAGTEPCSSDVIKLNELSSSQFQSPGQWVKWTLKVDKAGLYKIAVRYKQDARDGGYSSRRILIDGTVPFDEASKVRFYYTDSWKVSALSTAEGEPLLFYLDAGKHDIEMQVVLGDLASPVSQVNDIIYNLNSCYRKIIMITGTQPDTYRDYQFEDIIPDAIAELKNSSNALKKVAQQLQGGSGDKGSFVSIFQKLSFDIDAMVNDPKKIASKLDDFKSYLSSLASWVLDTTYQPVDMDWIEFEGSDLELPQSDKGFFSNVWYQMKLFASSFYMDYSILGNTGNNGKKMDTIKVWLGSGLTGGRDQAQTIKRLIDQEFTKKYNINVDFQLVAQGTLLAATLAGTGPDVALQVSNTDPLNYSIRGAVADLTQFSDFNEVKKRFNSNAMIPYSYNGKVYALPETYTYQMMFYRTDILNELGIKLPKTWDQVYDVIEKLGTNNMRFGLPTDINTLAMLLYQNGCSFYHDNGKSSALDDQKAMKVFNMWTEFYTDYDLLVQYDFANRFRTGEMPIAIADFSMYNQLSVFAPEIKGLWGFTQVPGTVKEDGTIDHTVSSTGVACVIMGNTKYKSDAWKFISWWTSTSAQVAYGKGLESIMGVAARYPSANQEAISKIPWPKKDYESLMSQWDSVKGIPECPGSYITPRYVDFAFKAVINNVQDPGMEILSFTKLINKELTRKRKEFGVK